MRFQCLYPPLGQCGFVDENRSLFVIAGFFSFSMEKRIREFGIRTTRLLNQGNLIADLDLNQFLGQRQRKERIEQRLIGSSAEERSKTKGRSKE